MDSSNVSNINYDGVDLIKWPQMIVWGSPISEEQAKQVIFRTDAFFTSLYESGGGNNSKWNKWAWRKIGFSPLMKKLDDNELFMAEGSKWVISSFIQQKIEEFCQVVDTNYVYNRWASSCFVFGPAGWCHPDGSIFFEHNVGKWPDASSILDEWSRIASAFPFLNLTVTLMDKESMEDNKSPVVTIKVADGVAVYAPLELPSADLSVKFKPELGDFFNLHHETRTGYTASNGAPPQTHENGLPDLWIEEFSDRVKPFVDNLNIFVDRVIKHVSSKKFKAIVKDGRVTSEHIEEFIQSKKLLT